MLNLPPPTVVSLLCYTQGDATNASVEWVFAKQDKLAGQESFVQDVTESRTSGCSLPTSYP